ncbi:MAG: hypothetical protein LBQ86_03595 [Holophagales bacterium]|nr:hypothetical protein [Holophagales bacterium]
MPIVPAQLHLLALLRRLGLLQVGLRALGIISPPCIQFVKYRLNTLPYIMVK